MKINATQNAAQSPLQPAAPRANFQADFQATLKAAKQHLAQPGETTPPVKSTEGGREHVPKSQMTPLEFLEDYLRKSPEQHMRDAILREMGLTEEDLAALPPEERAAIEQTITEKVKELLQRQTGNAQNQGQPSSVAIQPF
ncbi:MAG: hypothetical protein WC091_24405 [Sulfuricellaceae bacterium]